MTTRRERRLAALACAGVMAVLCAGPGGAASADDTSAPASQSGESRIAPVKPPTPVVLKGEDARWVVLKFVQGSDVRLSRGVFSSPSGKYDAGSVNAALGKYGAVAEPAFRQGADRLDALVREAQARSGREHADFRLYFDVAVPDGADTNGLLTALNKLPVVEIAHARGVGRLPTPSYEGYQTYTDAAPDGIDSDFAQDVVGGDGLNVRIVDVEGGWNLDHEDLNLPAWALIEGHHCTASAWWQHGTAVLGELVADSNAYGVTGMVPASSVRVSSVWQGASCSLYDGLQAVVSAIDHLQSDGVPGGVILIEQHVDVPGTGYLPMEYYQDWYDTLTLATSLGIVVVEAAGNGGNDLDAFTKYGQPIFDRTFRDSGAIMAGAGCPPFVPVNHPNCVEDGAAVNEPGWWGSNFGSRVDLQGYGAGVTTTGYGWLYDLGDDVKYTERFNGTSSASPIVTAAAASVVGAYYDTYGSVPTPDYVRTLLVQTGTPQPAPDASVRPIGPRPDLKAALCEIMVLCLLLRLDGYWVAVDPWPDPWPCLSCPFELLDKVLDRVRWPDRAPSPAELQVAADEVGLRVTSYDVNVMSEVLAQASPSQYSR